MVEPDTTTAPQAPAGRSDLPSPPTGTTESDERYEAFLAELGDIAGKLNVLHGRLTELAAEADATNLWEGHGITSIGQFFSWQLGISKAHADQLVRIARRRDDLPLVTAKLDEGLLSADQVDPIATRIPTSDTADRHFAEVASEMTVKQIRTAVRATVPPDQKPDTTSEDERAATADDPDTDALGPRSITFGHDDDGTWRLLVKAGASDGAAFETSLRACHDALWHEHKALLRDLPDGAEAPPAPTWFDAFARMTERSLEREATERPHSQRTKVVMHIRDNGLAQLHLGPALSVAERAMLTCDASIVAVLERNGTPVSCGREHRIVPDKARMLIEHRDGGCAVPWCGSTKHLVIHHIVHWEHGGPTDTWNLISLCPRHHRAVHAETLHITGNADTPGGLTITDKRKRRVSGRSAAQTPHEPIPPSPQPYRHPWGLPVDWHSYVPPHIHPPDTTEPAAA